MIEYINPGFVILFVLLLIPLLGLIVSSKKNEFPIFFTTLVAIATFIIFYYMPNSLYQKVTNNINHFNGGGDLICYKILNSTGYKISKNNGYSIDSKNTVVKENKNTIIRLDLQLCNIKDK